MSRQKKLINKTNYPQHAIEKFARCVYPDIVAFYQSEEGQREFAEWQAEQAAKKAQRKLHTTKKEVTAAVTSVVILWAFSSVGLLAWKWEECGSRWGSRLARIARNKQIIRTRPRLGRTGSDYIALVREMGLEPTRRSPHAPQTCLSTIPTLSQVLSYYNCCFLICQLLFHFLSDPKINRSFSSRVNALTSSSRFRASEWDAQPS